MAVTVSIPSVRGYAMDTLPGVMVGYRCSALFSLTLNPDLALASGISPRRKQLVLSIALAIVAVAIKVVSVLLIAAMLIIPAATVRRFSRTPEAMALMAAIIGACASVAGLTFSYRFDSPTAPAIVCVVAVLFVGLNAASALSWRATNQSSSDQQFS